MAGYYPRGEVSALCQSQELCSVHRMLSQRSHDMGQCDIYSPTSECTSVVLLIKYYVLFILRIGSKSMLSICSSTLTYNGS